ncbi:MAG: LysM peptidoglycan-binding domain-containing protein [Actinomycetota bacterium]
MAKAHPLTEPLEPYQPLSTRDSYDEDYDWEYDDDPAPRRRPMKVLWGRVAVLGAALIAMFLFGRMTAGGGDDAALTEARDRITTLEESNASLQTELEATQTELDKAQTELAAGATAPETTATEETASDTEITGEIYVVRSGDTLTTIAERFYNDASLDDYLAEVNNITDPTALHVGQELIIPDNPPKQ